MSPERQTRSKCRLSPMSQRNHRSFAWRSEQCRTRMGYFTCLDSLQARLHPTLKGSSMRKVKPGVQVVERRESPELPLKHGEVTISIVAVIIEHPAAEIHAAAAEIFQFRDTGIAASAHGETGQLEGHRQRRALVLVTDDIVATAIKGEHPPILLPRAKHAAVEAPFSSPLVRSKSTLRPIAERTASPRYTPSRLSIAL